MVKKRILPWVVVATILWIAVVLFRSYFSDDRLNVEPHADKEIEKAKRR